MIDISRPLELADGTQATLMGTSVSGQRPILLVRVGKNSRRRFYRDTGEHCMGRLPKLRNAAPWSPRQPHAVKEPFSFVDVSVEVSRTYTFPNGTVTIDAPVKLHVSPTHSHRLIDAAGRSHYVPAGWLHLSWTVKPGCPHFVA